MKDSRLALSSHAVRIMVASDFLNPSISSSSRRHEDHEGTRTNYRFFVFFVAFVTNGRSNELAEGVERPGDAERPGRGLRHFEQQPRVDAEDNRRRDRD